MKKKYFLVLYLFFYTYLFSQNTNSVIGIYTLENGVNTVELSTTRSLKNNDKSRNLLAFTIDGNKYYTTGIDDNKVNLADCSISSPTSPCKKKGYYKAFPTGFLSKLKFDNISSNLIGIPRGYQSIVETYPNNYRYYLADGKKGLDISTAVFNIVLDDALISFIDVAVSKESVNDGIPDVIVTQTGQPSSISDVYSFKNVLGNNVGTPKSVDFRQISVVANTRYAFYNYNYNEEDNDNAMISTSSFNSGASNGIVSAMANAPAGSRDLRVMAFDWADLGITTEDATAGSYYEKIYSFNQQFNGDSDVAFIAFNEESLFFKRSISGNVKEVKLDGVTRVPFAPSNIVVDLFIVKAGVVEATPLRTASVDVNGDYSFEDVFSNLPEESYRVVPRVLNFNQNNPYYVVENSNGTLNGYQEFKIEYDDFENINFVLGNFCVKAPFKTETIGISTPVAISTLNKQASNWPNAIPNAALVLDSKEKGLVIPRTNASLILTENLVEGMIIYDTTANCIKLYDGNKWICIERDCNEN